MKNSILYGFLTFLLGMMLFFSIKAYHQALLYEQTTTELVAYQGASQQASRKVGEIAKSILGELYVDERQPLIDIIIQKKQKAMVDAKAYTLSAMLLLILLLIVALWHSLHTVTLFGSLGAMVALLFGLVSPILMVTIHKEVAYLGDIVLSFESKGVIGSIDKLFESGDVVVAVVILLFSVLTPVLKILSLFFVCLFVEYPFAHALVKFFKLIGKWSMVDVFVVAVFLVYLTANKAEVSRAEVEIGLYFFLAYVIVSMLVSLSADRMLHNRKKAQGF